MVSLGEFLLGFDVLLQLGVFGEGNSVDSLQVVVVFVGQPVSRRVFRDLEALDFVGAREMRACAQIDEFSAPVGRCEAFLRDLGLDKLHLEWIVSEHLQSLIFCQDDPLEGLLIMNEFFNVTFNFLVVGLGNLVVAHKAVIEESVVEWRPMAQPGPVELLECFTKEMCTGMPEDLLALDIVEGEELQEAVALEGTRQIDEFAVLLLFLGMVVFSLGADAALAELEVEPLAVEDLGDEGVLGQLLGDGGGDGNGC